MMKATTNVTLKMYFEEIGLTTRPALTQTEQFEQDFMEFESKQLRWLSQFEKDSYHAAKAKITKMLFPVNDFDLPHALPEDMEITIIGKAIPTKSLTEEVSQKATLVKRVARIVKKRALRCTEKWTGKLADLAASITCKIEEIKKRPIRAKEQVLVRDFLPAWMGAGPSLPEPQEIDQILELLAPIVDDDILLDLFMNAEECQEILGAISASTYNRFKALIVTIARVFPNTINPVAEIHQLVTPFTDSESQRKYCNRYNKKQISDRFDWINSFRFAIPAREEGLADFLGLTQIGKTLDSVSNVADKASKFMDATEDKVKAVTDKADAVLVQINDALGDPDSKTSQSLNLVANAKKNAPAILACVLALVSSPDKVSLMAHILSISYMMGINQVIYKKIMDYFGATTPESDEEFVDAREESFGPTMQLLGIGASLLGKFSPSRLIAGSDRSFFTAQKEMEAMEKISTLVMGALEEWGIYETERSKTISKLRTQLKSAIENCAEYETIMTTKPTLFLRDKYFNKFMQDCAMVEQIKLEVANKSYHELSGTNFATEVMSLSTRFLAIRRVVEKTRNCSGKRPNTVGVAFLGEPGIGKSQLQTNMAVLLRKYYKDNLANNPAWEEFSDVDQWKTWNQNSRDQYHEGYTGQEIHSNDDMFQSADDSDHLDFINMLSCNTFPTRQAELSNKGLAYRSRLLVGSCNNFPTTSRTINDIQALQRRFNVVHATKKHEPSATFDPKFSHLEFLVWSDGRLYAEDSQNMTQIHCRKMTLDELIRSLFEQMRYAFELFEQNIAFEEQAASYPEDFYQYRNLTRAQFAEIQANGRQLPGEWIDSIMQAPVGVVRHLRMTKVLTEDGLLMSLSDLAASNPLWKQTTTVLGAYTFMTKLDYHRQAFGKEYWAETDGNIVSVQWYDDKCIIGKAGPEVFYNTMDDEEFEQEKSLWGKCSEFLWNTLKTTLSYIFQACVFWDEKVVSPVATAFAHFLHFLTGVDIKNDPLMKDVYWFLKLEASLIISQIAFVVVMMIWLSVRCFALRATQTCSACSDERRASFHQKLLCEYCRSHCQLGTFYTTHTEQCKRLKLTIDTIAAYTCQPCINGFCDKQCPHYSVVVEECDTRIIPEYLEAVREVCSKEEFDDEVDLLEGFFEDSSMSHVTKKKLKSIYESSSESRKTKKKADVKFESGSLRSARKEVVPRQESSSESRKAKKKTTSTFEAGGYPEPCHKVKVAAAFEDLSAEQAELFGDEEMAIDPNAVQLHKRVKENTVGIWAVRNKVVVSRIHGLAFGKHIIIPRHFPSTNDYDYYMVDTRAQPLPEHIRASLNKVTTSILVNEKEVEVTAGTQMKIPRSHLVPVRHLASHAKHDCSLWTHDATEFSSAVYQNLISTSALISNSSKLTNALQYAPTTDITYAVTVDMAKSVRFKLNSGIKEYEQMLMIKAMKLAGAQTLPGDCGGAVIALDKRFPKKILGFHVIGATDASYACILTRDMIDELLAVEATQEGLVVENIIEADGVYPIADDLDLIAFESEGNLTPEGAIQPIGLVEKVYAEAGPTSIQRHALAGTFPDTMAPAPARPDKVEDKSKLMKNGYGVPDILYTQYAKYAAPEPQVEGLQDHLNEMVEELKDHYIRVLRKEDTSMSDEVDAINGVATNPDSHPLDVRTSPGVPWSNLMQKKADFLENHPLENGANSFIINRDTDSGRKLLAAINRKRNLAKHLVRTASIWKNCLKDETRPIEKCKVGKTRLFTAAPFETVYLFRELYAKFKVAWTKHRSELLHSVGINPMSMEWTELYNTMCKYAPEGNDADFGRFDGCLRSDFMRAAGRVVNETIFALNPALTQEDMNVYNVLWEEIVTTLQVSRNEVSLTTHGNPSGNPMTTVVNCIVNLMYHWYAYRRITGMRSLASFRKEVFFTCFGDDVMFVTNHRMNGYSFQAVAEIMEELGQEYTTASKDAATDGAEKPITELQFLKRKFAPQSTAFVLAPLERESIEQQFNWTMMNLTEWEAMNAQITEACIEAAAHGEGYYTIFRRKIRDAIHDKNLSDVLDEPVSYADSRLVLLKRIDGTIVAPRK